MRRGPADAECLSKFRYGFAHCGEPAQLFLAFRGQLGRLGGRQLANSAGVARGGAPLAAELEFEFEFEFGQRCHNGGHRTPCRCTGVYAFTQRAQQDSALAKICDGAGYFYDRSASRSMAVTTTVSPSRA